jgi:signal transduction histidine kinase
MGRAPPGRINVIPSFLLTLIKSEWYLFYLATRARIRPPCGHKQDPMHPITPFDFGIFLDACRKTVIEAWVNRLHTQADSQYARRPREELLGTVTEAFDANYQVLVHKNYAPIDHFIRKITRLRLSAGFSLSGVQNAFELFREIVLLLMARDLSAQMIDQFITPLNHCLAYTIHRFSDYFQEMHEKTIREHNLHLEELVRDRTAALIESERMATIGQITTSLSHEIRNPLSAVKMNLQILRKNLDLSGNDQRRLEISLGEVVRLEGILKELLDFAKPLRIQHSPCDVNQILAAAIELLEIKFEEKGIRILKSFDPHIPMIAADREKLGQALINLLLNALEASDSPTMVQVTSRYAGHPHNPAIDVCIKDQGHGIPRDLLCHIFEPFFSTKSRGTGLGLTNTRRIITAHGGTVEASIREAPGVSFNVRLPAVAGQDPIWEHPEG